MQRIFLGLAIVAVLLLSANVVIGLAGGDYNAVCHKYLRLGEEYRQLEASGELTREELAVAREKRNEAQLAVKAKVAELQPMMTRHMLIGILSALISLLVCSVSITYFVGTSKWFKEVVETYKLDPNYVQQSARIKRRSFRWSVAGALMIVLVVGLGAASEPTWANARNSQTFVTPHYIAALGCIAFLLISFYKQGTALSENGQLIERVMTDVRRIRSERGLSVEPESSHS